MVDPMRCPVTGIADLYAHRCEIELGYREMKQYMLKNELTLQVQENRNDTARIMGGFIGL